MEKTDIKAMMKNLEKNELRALILVAQEVGVGVKTSFYMRHRILDIINLLLKNDKVEGIVEVELKL